MLAKETERKDFEYITHLRIHLENANVSPKAERKHFK